MVVDATAPPATADDADLPRERDLRKRCATSRARRPSSAKRLDDYQLQMALDYLHSWSVFSQQSCEGVERSEALAELDFTGRSRVFSDDPSGARIALAAPTQGGAHVVRSSPRRWGMDEYQRLMAERNAASEEEAHDLRPGRGRRGRRRGFFLMDEPQEEEAGPEVLDAGGRFAERDKADMGPFWNCVMASEIDVGMFKSGDQIQQRDRERLLHPAEDLLRAPDHRVRAQDRGARSGRGRARERHARGAQAAADKYVGVAAARCRRGSRATPRS